MSDKKEMVNHPEHYRGNKYEAIDIIEDYNLGFNLGNAVKYILRCEKKGNKIEDIQKAIWYLDREIYMENNPRKAATTNITLPEERSQALRNVINAINKNKCYVCSVCGKGIKEGQRICDECYKNIPCGISISEYIEKAQKAKKQRKGKYIKCMSCGDYFVPENAVDLICENCKVKYVDENENEYKCVDNRNKYPSFYAEDYCGDEIND